MAASTGIYGVWSELNDKPISDCTYSSGLMALKYGGFDDFPLGAYTGEERNALERSDSYPDGRGSRLIDLDEAIKNRYGQVLHGDVPLTAAAVRALLNKPGLAVVLQGDYLGCPSSMRRWQPGFTGGHCVAVITLGGGKVLWLDPLAYMHFGGDVISVDDALKFWNKPGKGYGLRYIAKDELMLKITITLYPGPRAISCYPPFPGKSGELYPPTIRAYAPPSHDLAKSMTLTKGSMFHARGEAVVYGWDKDPNKAYYYWVADDGYFKDLFVAKTNLTVASEPIPSIEAAVKEATSSLEEKIAKAREVLG